MTKKGFDVASLVKVVVHPDYLTEQNSMSSSLIALMDYMLFFFPVHMNASFVTYEFSLHYLTE